MRKTLIPASALLGLALFVPAQPAHAVSKEIIQLQTQVQGLQDMLQQIQRSNSEQMGVLQHLVEQSNDNINRMTQQMNALQAKVEAAGQNNQLSTQIQSLNDSVDALKTRLSRIDSTLASIQSQMQNVSTPPPGAAPAGSPGGAPAAGNGGSPQQSSPAAPSQGGTTVPLAGQTPQGAAAAPPQAQAPPVAQLYQSAERDYNSAKYDLATSEFADVIKYYPQDPLSGSASFYLGEIAYRQGLYPAAIKNYDVVIDQFPGSRKAPAARLRKGEAELAGSQRSEGISDLRALVARYPTSPEGAQARSLLNGMGVRLRASKTSPYHRE